MSENACENLPPDFYEDSLHSWNPVTRYYHAARYRKILGYISDRYSDGDAILDIGCGSSIWNTAGLPVTGVDTNRSMLEKGKKDGSIAEGVVWDLTEVPLPFEEDTFDFIVVSEVLEHLEDPDQIIRESARIQKQGGFLITTVPLDTDFSIWSILFKMNCFIRGDVLGEEIYKKRCGHIQHFSEKDIVALLERNGYVIIDKDISALNIALLSKKR